MTSATSPVVPKSLARAKSIAKQLHLLYPRHKLSTCQAVTAHLFFHPDWHALEAAIKSGKTPGKFDDELNHKERNLRFSAQSKILIEELSGRKAAEIIADKENATNEELSQRMWYWFFTEHVLEETAPTSSKHPTEPETQDDSTMCSAECLSVLPQRLSKWWRINIPEQPEVADALEEFILKPNQKTSLMKFGVYLGTLAIHYSHRISRPMEIGLAYLLAERYQAVLHSSAKDDFRQTMLGIKNAGLKTKDRPVKFAEPDGYAQGILMYLSFYPVDMSLSYRVQPEVFHKHARTQIKELDLTNFWDGVEFGVFTTP